MNYVDGRTPADVETSISDDVTVSAIGWKKLEGEYTYETAAANAWVCRVTVQGRYPVSYDKMH